MEEKKKFSIGKLFRNNRFVLIFSLFIAVVLWFIMAAFNTEQRPRVILDIPINIELPSHAKENEYRIFSTSDTKASATVKGAAFEVNTLDNNSINIKVDSFPAIRSGSFTLDLSAEKSNLGANYEIESINPTSVIVFIDKYKEKSLPIESDISFETKGDVYVSDISFDTENIKLQGPERMIERVAHVYATAEIDNAITDTVKIVAPLVLKDENGEIIDNSDNLISFSDNKLECDVTINVLSVKELPVELTFNNAPTGIDLFSKFSVKESLVKVAGPLNVLNKMQSIKLPPINFSTLNENSSTISLPVSLPDDIINVENLNAIDVNVKLDDYSSKSVNVNNFSIINPNNVNAELINRNVIVIICANKNVINSLEGASCFAEVDLSEIGAIPGSYDVPLTMRFYNTNTDGWFYGEYTASIIVSENLS